MRIMMKHREQNNYLEKSKLPRKLKRDKPNSQPLYKKKSKKLLDDDWADY